MADPNHFFDCLLFEYMNDQEHKCQCSFSIRMTGDGCRYCQPQEYIDRLHDSMEDMIHFEQISEEGAISLYRSWLLMGNDPVVLVRRIEQFIKEGE
jgi:hypothetical protein